MKFFDKTVSLVFKSHLVVTLAATLLGYQTLLLTGDANWRNPVLLIIFSGTVFIYNLAGLLIHVPSFSGNGNRRKNNSTSNQRFHIALCVVSFAAFLAGFSKTTSSEKVVILLTGVCAIAYEMPFARNNQRLKGFRNILFLKNILLTLVWTMATGLLPLLSKTGLLHSHDLLFICLKRFFFVLPLALVFDVRDYNHDLRHELKTIPNQWGIQTTKLIALAAIALFAVIIYLHKMSMEATSSPLLDFSEPLYLSAIITSIFIMMINNTRKNAYYIFVIDGSMILQFVLVWTTLHLKIQF